jgi:hypothetical protein
MSIFNDNKKRDLKAKLEIRAEISENQLRKISLPLKQSIFD